MFITTKSNLIDIMMNPEISSELCGKNNSLEDLSKETLVKALYELIDLADNMPEMANIKVPKNLGPLMYDLMKHMYAAGSHICEKLDVGYDGIVRDGKGFVYAGWAKKSFKLGDHLPKKYSSKIYNLAHCVCDNPPRVMLSSVDAEDPKREYYFYFKSVGDDPSTEHYECYDITINSENFQRVPTFYHYIYEFLSKDIKHVEKINLDYPLSSKEQDILVELENYPMGTLINTMNRLIVKSSPIGSFDYMEVYNGAIDL